MPTSADLRAERANIFDRMQEIVDSAETDGRDLSTEEQENFDQAGRDMDALMARIQRMESLESTRADLSASNHTTATNAGRTIGGPNTSVITDQRGLVVLDDAQRSRWARWQSVAQQRFVEPEQVDVDHIQNYTRAFNRYMRRPHGAAPISNEEATLLGQYHNVLGTSSGTAGGYLVPPEMLQTIERAMLWFGGMRQVASRITTSSGADLPFPTNDDTGNTGEIVGEGGTVSEQQTSFGQRTMKAFVFSSKFIRVSHQLLVDSAVDIASYVAQIGGERIGRYQNTMFTTGAGPNQPSGIIGDVTTGKTAAGTTAIQADELIDLLHSVDVAYRGPNCRWMMHDLILAVIRKMKDGEGNYLLSPGLQPGVPDRILGYPYQVNNDMQSTVATGTTTVLFGDFSRYKIRDVEGVQLMRLEELYALSLQVAFLMFARADGALIDAGQHPVKALVQA